MNLVIDAFRITGRLAEYKFFILLIQIVINFTSSLIDAMRKEIRKVTQEKTVDSPFHSKFKYTRKTKTNKMEK